MKRNPIYSPRAKSEQRGYKVNKFRTEFETKQEKFNRIFDVEDAKVVK